jgi:RNA polymerase sigma-70 factor (ECF subfamily)
MELNKKHEKEIAIFNRIKDGDCNSFKKLFAIYYEPLCNFAYLFIQDKSIAEEAVSDVFISIWQKRKSINIKKNLRAYLYKSTKNAALSYTKKHTINTINIENIRDKNEFDTPETLLFKAERTSFTNKIIISLPKRAGLVFRLHKVDGLKYKEIAEVLSISEKTVENHMGNALRHLRNLAHKHPEIIDYLISALLIGLTWNPIFFK